MPEDLFELPHAYDAMLQQGLDLSGEDPQFFIRGRLRDLQTQLPVGWMPKRILDFGCGIGHTARQLSALYPDAQVTGIDTSDNALAHARSLAPSARISFVHSRELPEIETFDLCYVNGVFHHVDSAYWPTLAQRLFRAINPNGFLALFENNPLSPAARWVMSRIPFDRNATMLSAAKARRLCRDAGFGRLSTRYLFYFPRSLAFLRPAEAWLTRLPLGAQYYVLAQK